MIPRRAFWFFDLLMFGFAFAFTVTLVPAVRALLLPGGALRPLIPPGVLPPWTGDVPPYSDLAWLLMVVGVVGVVAITLLGGHEELLEQSLTRIILTSVGAPLLGLAAVTMVLFGMKSPDWSRLFIFSFTTFSSIGLLAYRLILRSYFRARQRLGFYARNLLLLGSPGALAQVAGRLEGWTEAGAYRLFGYLRLPDMAEADYPPDVLCLGTVEQLDSLLIRFPVHQVLAIEPAAGASWLEKVLRDCDQVGVPVQVLPEALLRFEPTTLRHESAGIGLPGMMLAPPTFNSESLFFKRIIDVALAAILLLILSPVMALVALAVRLSSPGPVLYSWKVIGHHGQEFSSYKFRTMVQNADELKKELMASNEMSGPVFKMAKDPRVTKVGRVLRKFSLDELPQLFSVLKGDMSLVGPRPAFRTELERYEFWQMRKLSIRPGITCLWQVRGRNAINDFNEWVKMDLEYIDNWSLWLDMKILLWTAKAVIAGTGK